MATVHSSSGFVDGVVQFCSRFGLTDAQFEDLSQKATRDLRENKSAYKTKVIALALLGYTYIFLVVGFILAIIGALFMGLVYSHHFFAGGKLLIVLGALVIVLLRALWVKNLEPEGIELKRQDYPVLFDLVDSYCDSLNTHVDKILVDDAFNAYVKQVSKAGIFDFHSNYMVLGMPLLLCQSADQIKAVVAHELGHLSGNHSRSTAWIYGLRIRWAQLLDTLVVDSPLVFAVFYVFFSWLSPRFAAYSLALARAHETEADIDAAGLAGGWNLGSSLTLVEVKARLLGEDVWPTIFKRMNDEAEAPKNVYSEVGELLRTIEKDPQTLHKWVSEALAEKGSGADTHPPLAERLASVKVLQDVSGSDIEKLVKPISLEETAASVFFGAKLPELIETLSDKWREQNGEAWKGRHEFLAAKKEKLAELEKKSETEELSVDDLREKASCLYELDGFEATKPIYEEVLTKDPQHAMANYALGLHYLKVGDEKGIGHIEVSMAKDQTLIQPGLDLIMSYLKEHERDADLEKYQKKADDYNKLADLARKERQGITDHDGLDAYVLEKEYMDYLQGVFASISQIREVYLAAKRVVYLPDYRYLVLGVEADLNAEAKLEVARFLVGNLQMPEQFCVSVFEFTTGKLKKNMQAVEGSLIYKRQ